MAGLIFKNTIDLFIRMGLPLWIYNKRKYAKNTPRIFVNYFCFVVGIAIVEFAILSFLQSIFS